MSMSESILNYSFLASYFIIMKHRDEIKSNSQKNTEKQQLTKKITEKQQLKKKKARRKK